MANYYIDPVSGTGNGISQSLAAGSLPSPLVNDTIYLFKNNTTYVRSTTIGITDKSNIQFGSYGTGKATINCNSSSNITMSTGGTTANLVLSNLIFIGSDNATTVFIGSNVSLISISNVDFIKSNIGTGDHFYVGGNYNASNVTISDTTFSNGQAGVLFQCTRTNLTSSNWNFQNITATQLKNRVIRLSIEPTNNAWDSSNLQNIIVNNCSVSNCYGGIWFKVCNTSLSETALWTPPVRGNNITVTNSSFQYTTLDINNIHAGGINITGFNNCYIGNNYLKNVTTHGAAIQTIMCTNMIIERNYVEHAVAQNKNVSGLYIDALGIFLDAGDQYCTARYNTIVDCPGYNIESNVQLMSDNSGGGIGFWNSGYNNVYCNLILSSRYGISYGQTNEIGNKAFNNYILDCSNTAFRKHGTAYLAGNIALFNNGIINTGSVSFATQNLCANISYNETFNTTSNAKLVLDTNGVPTGITYDPKFIKKGTTLDGTYYDENGVEFHSPPNIGSFSNINGIVDMMTNSVSAPKLLFHTTFDGMTLNVAGTFAPDSADPSRNFYTRFSNATDTTTGYNIDTTIDSLFGSATTVQLQSIPQNSILLSNFGTYFSSNIANGELTVQCNLRDTPNSPNPQTHLLFSRSAAQALANDVEELCVMSYVKIPANLNLQNAIVSTGRFFEVMEYKTGGYNGLNGVGDMRFKVELTGNNGYNEWSLAVDDGANGYGIIPGLGNSANTVNVYARIYTSEPVQLDVYTKCYLYWNRPKCQLKLAIHPDGGEFKFLAEVTKEHMLSSVLNKSTLYGIADLPFTRLFVVSNYTSSNNLPVPTKCKELQLWDKPPVRFQ